MTEAAVFNTERGLTEVHFTMESTGAEAIPAREIAAFRAAYLRRCREYGCDADSEIFLRFHLRDSADAELVREFFGMGNGYLSLIRQPPVSGAAVALEARHLLGPVTKRTTASGCDIALEHYRMFYHHAPEDGTGDPGEQTDAAFRALSGELTSRGGTLKDNCVRTWIYCRDIDRNYGDMVRARTAFFTGHGLCEDTHYIASTGIAGEGVGAAAFVCMDSCSLFGQRPEQIEYMTALDHMPHTHTYQVTFERGVRLIFGDRSHYHLSGTASIDRDGRIVHPGDAAAQTGRMVENVGALLRHHEAGFEDLMSATVYLRQRSDRAAVTERLNELLPPQVPRIILHAPVCRPGWLVEMDAVAVNRRGRAGFADFR